MSTFTEHYNLIMPSLEDYYDVQDFNENTEAIDGLLYEQESAIAHVGEKADQILERIGTPEDTGTETLFGRTKELFYFPNQEKVVQHMENVTVPTQYAADGTMFLGYFFAEHDGVIYYTARVSYDGGSSPDYSIYLYTDKITSYYPNTVPGSYMGTNPSVPDIILPRGKMVNQLFHVEKGRPYVFSLYFKNMNSMTLDEFKICYEIRTAE